MGTLPFITRTRSLNRTVAMCVLPVPDLRTIAGQPLARIIHEYTAADADLPASSDRTPCGLVNVVSTTPTRSSVRAP